MVMIVCEETGISFEAPSRRSKIHPRIKAWKNQAYEERWYQQCLDALRRGREDGYTTIEQYDELLNRVQATAIAEKRQRDHEQFERERAAKEARRKLSIVNELLRGRGYVWKDLGYGDDEEIDNAILPYIKENVPDWQLFSPDGRAVSLEEAMQELAWQGVTWAKEWLAERNIAERKPEIVERHEREAATAQAEIAQYSPEMQQHQQCLQQALQRAGLSEHEALLQSVRLCKPHRPEEDRVRLGDADWTKDGKMVEIVMDSDAAIGVLIDQVWYGAEEALRQRRDLPYALESRLRRLVNYAR